MNIRILLVLLVVFVSACTEKGKTTKNENEAKETSVASEEEFTINKKTSKHINIPGTRLFIIPPKGFKVSKSMSGLEKDDMGIQVFDLIGGDFYSNGKTYSKEALKNSGVKVYEYKEMKANNYPAKYSIIEGDNNLKVINLIFGDTTFCTMVMAVFPASDKHTGAELKKSLQTIYYDKDFTINPLETAQFTLDDSSSKFKFAKAAASIMMYTIDGVDKESYGNEPMVMVNTLPIDGSMTLRSTAERIISGLEKKSLVVSEIKNKSTKVVDDVRTYEIDVHGTFKGEKMIMYVMVAADYERIITIQGIVKSDFEENLKEIKKLTSTLKLK
ncbi:hypothetical protein [uncultured Kordia sp.]|uniref:hypothetical protein n=1 Tax=uncultured Kordia sp. TaxID=507699 RepID=UPI00260FFA71|nr:hypothetical protein [uncultured Kordia sp.]